MLTVVGFQFNVVFIMIKRWSFLLLSLKVFARAALLLSQVSSTSRSAPAHMISDVHALSFTNC